MKVPKEFFFKQIQEFPSHALTIICLTQIILSIAIFVVLVGTH